MRLLALLFLILLCTCGRAQSAEFTIYDNGFIYPEATMSDLEYIVDSLELKFRRCDLDRQYFAPAQTMASCYQVGNSDWKAVRRHLAKAAENGVVDVKASYPEAALVRRGILYVSAGSERNPGPRYNLLPLNYGNSLALNPEGENSGRVTDLIYVAKGYKNTQIWVLDEIPAARKMPGSYARMIQYVDCLVDTSQTIFLAGAGSSTGGYLRETKDEDGLMQLSELAEDYEELMPEYDVAPEDDPNYVQWMQWEKEMAAWNSGKRDWVNQMIKDDQRFAAAFEKVKEHVRNGHSVYEDLEYYLEAQGEYALALTSKRLRKVWGSCSQDQSPRIHAAQIARLAAAAVEWSVFLRAHLNIMNDRFDRASDGNYAYAGRGTYLAELEALGIDATDLLVGSCLQAEGLAANHYQSNWLRVGRALAEAQDQAAVIALLTRLIRDPELDDLNRLTGIYLLRFMANNYGQEDVDKRYTKALAAALTGVTAPWAKLVKAE